MMYRTSFFAVCLALCCSGLAFAQSLTLSLNISSHPNPYISSWETRRETAILTATNLTGAPVKGRLHARVLVDGDLKAETVLDRMPEITIPVGVSMYFADELVPGSAVKFYGSVDKTAQRTGMLPAGTYQFCVELADELGKPISVAACRGFNVTSYQLPVLLQPMADARFGRGQRPMFRWAPVVPPPPRGVIYRVLLFEVLEGQYPMQAFRANAPVMDLEVFRLNQLLWPAEFPLPDKAQKFVWTVQALDENRNPIGEREGFSEPVVFSCDGSVMPGDGSVLPGDGSVVPGDGSVRKMGDGSVKPGDGSVRPPSMQPGSK
jgi:hypothetical protein